MARRLEKFLQAVKVFASFWRSTGKRDLREAQKKVAARRNRI